MSNNFLWLPDGTMKLIDSKSSFPNLSLDWIEDHSNLLKNDKGVRQAYSLSVLMHRCITVKANTLSTIPKRFTNSVGEDLPQNHIVHHSLGRRRTKLWRVISQDWDVYGRVYLEPVKNPRTGVTYFKRINPYTVEIDKDSSGIREFRQVIKGQIVARWEPSQLVYIFDYNPEDDLEGLSPTSYILQSVATELSLADFVKAYFENGGTPAGILTTDQPLMANQQKKYAQDWKNNYGGGSQANKVAVLSGGLTYQPITPTIKDMVVDTISATITKRICQAYGVPLSLVFETDDENRATTDTARESFYKETMLPIFQFLADELSEQAIPFITDEDIYLEADLFRIDVLQNDRQIITERSTVGFKSGIRTINEARALEQLPRIDGGDVIFVGGRLIPKSDFANLNKVNQVLEGPNLNEKFTPNDTEPVNPDPQKQAYRNREAEPEVALEKNLNIRLASIIAITSDLKSWKKKALAKGFDTAFDSKVIPKTYQGFIRQELKHTENDPEKIKEIFDRYILLFENNLSDSEEFALVFKYNDYWKDVPDFYSRVEKIFLDYYFSGLLEEVVGYLQKYETFDGLSANVLQPRVNLVTELLTALGTEIGLAGLSRGYELTKKDGKSIHDVINRVIQTVQTFTKKFVEDINATTENTILTKLREWNSLGGSRSDFLNYIQNALDSMPEGFTKDRLKWLFSRVRAITFSEDYTNSVFNDAVLATYEELEFEAVWVTERDGKVCTICQPMEGVVGNIDSGFISPTTNQVVYPGRVHSRCRCFAEPTAGAFL